MKVRIISFLITLTLITQLVYSQSGWVVKNPYPNTNEDVYDVYFIDSQTGFFVTGQYRGYYPSYGRIYKTTDGGTNWDINFLDTSGTIIKIYFINSLTGFVSGPKVYKTTNCGSTWIPKRDGGLKSICFADSQTGYGCGPAGETAPVISKTTNGGENWFNLSHDITGYYANLYAIHFFNANTGIVAGWGYRIAKTTNGGINWVYKISLAIAIIFDMKFINDSVGFVSGNNQDSLILKTTNSGENWFLTNVQIGNFGFLESINFANNFTGFCVGGSNLLRSTDSGSNWLQVFNPFQNLGYHNLNRVHFRNSFTGYIIGDNCSFIKTTNYGNNWELFIRGDTLNALDFTNSTTGYCVGHNGIMIKTTNNGENWVKVNSGTISTINDLIFKDSNNGIYVGENGVCGKTTNSGSNWVVNVINSQINLKYIGFFDSNTGLIAGFRGKIFKTTNYGVTWNEKVSSTNFNLNSLYSIGPTIAIAVGDSGIITRTSNMGETWISQYTSPRIKLNSIGFLDENTGFIVGDSGKIFKSTNSGLNWFSQLPYTGQNLNYVEFINARVGYMLGNSNVCLKTTNGGETWGFQGFDYFQHTWDICKLYAFDSLNIFLTGSDQYIFKTTNGGGNMVLSIPIPNEIPEQFLLYQNYPNPFNPVTKIQFSIPPSKGARPSRLGSDEGMITKLVIYDILGKEVAVLVNEQLSPGVYEVEWNASGYSSGIYFYQLNITDASAPLSIMYSETKKMVLLK